MLRIYKVVVVFSVLLSSLIASFNLVADENKTYQSVVTELADLIKANKAEEAYAFAKQHNEFVGERDFDFLTGLAALKTQKPHEAVFALERAVNSQPSFLEARIQLIQAYYFASNFPAALNQISIAKVLSNDSPKQSQQLTRLTKIESLINNKIERQSSTLNQSLSVLAGFDSNINAGTAEDAIFLPTLNADVPLSQASKETSGHYIQLGYRGAYNKKLSQRETLKVNWNLADIHYGDKSEYNRTVLGASGNYQYRLGKNDYKASLSVSPLLLAGSLYRTASQLRLGVSHAIDKGLYLDGSAWLGKVNNVVADSLDMSSSGYSVGVRFQSNSIIHQSNLSIISEDADNEFASHNAKDSVDLNYQLGFIISNEQQFSLLVGIQDSTYNAEHPLFLMTREETQRYLSNNYRYKYSEDLAIDAKVSLQDKSSNLTLYEYDRLDASVSLVYQF